MGSGGFGLGSGGFGMGSGGFGMGSGGRGGSVGFQMGRRLSADMTHADVEAQKTHAGYKSLSDVLFYKNLKFLTRPATPLFGLDLKPAGLSLGATLTQINNLANMGIAKQINYNKYYGKVYTAPGGDFHTKHPDVWNVAPVLGGVVSMWAAEPEADCMFSERDLTIEFGKLVCDPAHGGASKCSTFQCPRSRKFTSWSKGRRLAGIEVETSESDGVVAGTMAQFPTVAHFDSTAVDGNRYLTTGGATTPRTIETYTKSADGKYTHANPALAAQGDVCFVTDKMIGDQCGEEVFAPPAACADDFTCPALPAKSTVYGNMVCEWSKDLHTEASCVSNNKCFNTKAPCLGEDDTCYARVLSNVTAGADGFGQQELTCPPKTNACAPGALTTVGFEHIEPFYNQPSYLTFGGVLGTGADKSADVCTLTQAAIKTKCGVQVCKAFTFKETGAVQDCGLVSQGPTTCKREVLANGCPSNACVDLRTSSCFDVNKDLAVDEQDAIILFTAGSVPKDFGGIELVEKYLKRDGVTKAVDSAETMHTRVQQCRAAKQYSFTTGFKQVTDRFDFVALYIAVTVAPEYGGKALLQDKILASFGTDAAGASERYALTLEAIKSKNIELP